MDTPMQKKKYQKLSVIIPAYNEASTIAKVLDKVMAVNLPQHLKKEIIVVDDCSADDTGVLVQQTADNLHISKQGDTTIKLIRLEKNSGKGSAVQTGIRLATGDIIIVQDADLEYDPEDYIQLLPPILSNGFKIVYGSRILNQDNSFSYQSFYWGGRLVSLTTSLLFGQKITDEPTCYKMFDAALLKAIPLTSKRFGFCPEVTSKVLRLGYTIKELPIHYYPRSKQEGKKIKWQDGIEAIAILCKYRLLSGWMKGLDAYLARPKKRFSWIGLSKNLLCLLPAVLLVLLTFSKSPGYNWVYSMLTGNMEQIKQYPDLDFDQKMQWKMGMDYNFLLTIKQNTPDDAVILFPGVEVFCQEGSPYHAELYNKIYSSRFIYPRKIVLENELETNKYAKEVTHVAIVNGKGGQYLPYPIPLSFQNGVLPIHEPSN